MAGYRIPADEIFRLLQTSEEGLTNLAAEIRLAQYGPNRLAEEEKVSRLKILIRQFTNRRWTIRHNTCCAWKREEEISRAQRLAPDVLYFNGVGCFIIVEGGRDARKAPRGEITDSIF